MGRYVFRLPDIGEGIAEAEIVAWHVKVGDRVEEDGALVDMMTDKATVEMESPVSGIVREMAGEAGQIVAIGSALVVIETDGDVEDAPGDESEREPSPLQGRALGEGSDVPVKVAPAKSVQLSPKAEREQKVLASPAVRARAKALGIDLSAISAGPEGIIHHADLDKFLTARAPAPPSEANRPIESLSGVGEQIKVIGLRRRIAENMAASKRHIPHFTYVEECDVTALEALRTRINAENTDGTRLTMLPFLITAICRSLPEFPMINARYNDDANVVTRYESVHLGVATQTDAGLMVPVIRDAQAKSLSQLGRDIARLAAAARDGTAKSDELSGSTLTVTSLGPLGGIATTPVINRPEVAIIGPNRIVERPVYVADGEGGERLEKRKLMNISISCDHRVVDGWDAASFVQAVKLQIEAPLLLLAG